MSKINTLD